MLSRSIHRAALTFVSAALVLTIHVVAAHAAVQRFAVIVGNDAGSGDDARLRYAETDAEKLARVLRDVGDFLPSDIAVLRGDSVEAFRTTLITVNDRIRNAARAPETQTLLFVYFSGHADAQALHMGSSRFDLKELGSLVRGSSATFRLLMVDACRSGALTRLKGGKVTASFALPGAPALYGEGMAFLTASAANEDAQESDALGGSFFTHAWISGLLGAADADGDGTVMLEESYRYAYAATVRTTSRSFAGTQHPSFQYDFRGHGAIPMSHLRRRGRGFLSLPVTSNYLVLRGHSEGQVVAEVGTLDAARTLSLEPGPYFLRGRGRDVLLEGTVNVTEGETRQVAESELARVEYARLVRKGGHERRVAQALELGPSLRSSLLEGSGACFGATVGYRVDVRAFGVLARGGACHAESANDVVQTSSDEFLLEVAALHTWDFSAVSVSAGAGAGVAVTTQHFTTSGTAPDRTSTAPLLLATVSVAADLTPRWYVGIDVLGEGHLLRIQGPATSDPKWEPAFAARSALFTGTRF